MIYAIENRYVNGIEIVKEISDENSNKAVFPVVFTSMLRSGSDTDNEIYYPENMKEVYALSQTPQVSLDHQYITEMENTFLCGTMFHSFMMRKR